MKNWKRILSLLLALTMCLSLLPLSALAEEPEEGADEAVLRGVCPPHTPGTVYAALMPTCITAGHIEYSVCTSCGAYLDASGNECAYADLVIPTTEHMLDHYQETAPTCLQDGHLEYWQCVNCGKYFTDADATDETTYEALVLSSELAHDWGEWEILQAPTATEAGEKRHVCTRCGRVEYAEIPATGAASDSVTVTEVYDDILADCYTLGRLAGFKLSNGKYYLGSGYAVNDTLTADEVDALNEVSGYDALLTGYDHEPLTETTEGSTCTVNGKHYYACGTCGKHFKDAAATIEGESSLPLDSEEHTWGEWITVTEATNVSPGLQRHSCDCGAEETWTVPAVGITDGWDIYYVIGDRLEDDIIFTGSNSLTFESELLAELTEASGNTAAYVRVHIGQDSLLEHTFTEEDGIFVWDSYLNLGASVLGDLPDGTYRIWADDANDPGVVNGEGALVEGRYTNSLVFYVEQEESGEELIASGVCGKNGDNLIWTLDNEGVLTISGAGEMAEWTYSYIPDTVNTPWYSVRNSILSVVIASGVTSVEDCSFYNCSNLTSVTIPKSVTAVGNSAFDNCPGLTSAGPVGSGCSIEFGWDDTLPANVFSNCGSLTSVMIPEGMTVIGNFAFYSCSGLTGAQIPDSVTVIGSSAFCNCYNLALVTLPKDMTVIDNAAFSGCSRLTSILIPDGVTSIESFAFYGCRNLTSVTIPGSVTDIGGNVFAGCSLTDVYYQGTEAQWQALLASVGNNNDPLLNATLHFQTCTVSYDANGGTGAPAFQIKTFGEALVLRDTIPSREGYAFLGWATSKNAAAAEYQPGDSYTADSSVILYAVWGHEIVASGLCGKNGDNLTWTLDSEGLLTISGTGEMADYLPRSAPWSYYRNRINTLFISEGVVSIGRYAFDYCTGLTSVTIPEGVTAVGLGAFYYCTGLTSVTIPEGVTAVEETTFYYCTGLTNITIPASVTAIGRHAFDNCANLTSVTVPGSLESIGKYAFCDCGNLTSVTIAGGVASIGDYTFHECGKLTGISSLNGLTAIGERAFSDCGSLANITLPGSLTSIGKGAFAMCGALTNITIPGSVTGIGDQAFFGCESLMSVTISEGVTGIGGQAFCSCSALTSLNLPNSLTSIGDGAFEYCTGLTSVTIPASVAAIGGFAFSDCTGLTSVTIPTGVIFIGERAFADCTGLTSVTIPAGVSSIGDGAFNYCTGLTSITIPESVTVIGSFAFKNCRALEHVTIPGGVTFINEGTFDFCYALEDIAIPEGVTGIGNYAFESCHSLTSVTIPDSVTAIGNHAFYCCYNLTSVTIPEGVTEIADYTFGDCQSLTSITIPDSVTSIGREAFFWCNSLTSIAIPEQVAFIGESAFEGCQRLGHIRIPASVTHISDRLFKGCFSLTYAVIPSAATSIGERAFSCFGLFGACSLEAVYYSGSETQWKTLLANTGAGNELLTTVTVYYNSDGPEEALIRTVSGVIDQGYLWTLRWECSYKEDPRGKTYDPELTIRMEGVDTREREKSVYAKTGDDLFPWLNAAGFDKSAYKKIRVYGTEQNPLVIIPNTFYGYSGITELNMAYVSAISGSAFENCTSLMLVRGFDDYLYSVGEKAFKNNARLTSIYGFEKAAGLEYINKEAFSGCSSLTFTSIPENVSTIGERAFQNCNNLSKVTITENLTAIGASAFSGCSRLVIYCYSDTEIYAYAVENNIPTRFLSSIGHVIYSSGENGKDRYFRFEIGEELEDLVYSTSAYSYNPRLAHFLANMARAAYDYDVLKENYEELGFTHTMHQFFNDPHKVYAPYYIGRKTTDDGKTLVMITIRGSEFLFSWEGIFEWLVTNFNITESFFYDGWHQGFDICASIVYNDLKAFMGGSIPTDNVTYVITGHSLGAGTSNLLAMKLIGQAGVSPKDIYDYNFACPNVAIGPEKESNWNPGGQYRNIININNQYDVVSSLPGALSERLALSNKLIARVFKGYSKWKKYGVSYWFDYEFHGWVKAHDMIAFLDYLELERDVTYFSSSEYEFDVDALFVGCPVDVIITDRSGEPIASVINNTACYYYYEPGERAIIMTYEDRKLFYIREPDWHVMFMASDFGEMDCVVSNVNLSSGEAGQTHCFEAVSLTPNKTMTSSVGSETPIEDVRLLVVDDQNTPIREVKEDGTEILYLEDPAKRPASLRIDREYLALKRTDTEQLLTLTNLPDEWARFVEWGSDNEDAVKVVRTNEGKGKLIPVAAGTAWIIASIDTGEDVLSARCRVDVVADTVTAAVEEVRLPVTKLTSELYSETFAALPVELVLTQNKTSAAADQLALADNGCAVTGAKFDDADTAAVFDLRVKDDRTLEIVPKEQFVNGDAATVKALKGSYKSSITVYVEGKSYYPAQIVTITLKKTTPKLTAKAVKLNSFAVSDTKPVEFNMAVESAELDNAPNKGKPYWLDYEKTARAVTYTDVNDVSRSGKLYLLVKPVGWNVKLPVVVSVSAAKTAPKLTLKTKALTLQPELDELAVAEMSVTPDEYTDPANWSIDVFSIMEGRREAPNELSVIPEGGSIYVRTCAGTPDDGKDHSYKVTLALWRGGEATSVRATLTVKLLGSRATPGLTAKAAGSIDTGIPHSPVTVQLTPRNINARTVRLTGFTVVCAEGTVTDRFEITAKDLTVIVSQKPGAVLNAGTAYTLEIANNVTAEPIAVKLAVKSTDPAKVKASVTLKASGSIDVIRPGTAVVLTPTIKNRYGHALSAADLLFYKNSAPIQQNELPFKVEVKSNTFVLTQSKPINHVSDKYTVGMSFDGLSTPKPIALPIKMGASKIAQSAKAVTLLKDDAFDRASIRLTPEAGLTQIARVDLTGPKNPDGTQVFTLIPLGGGEYAIGYNGNELPLSGKGGAVKLQVYLDGNETANNPKPIPNATLSVNVTLG